MKKLLALIAALSLVLTSGCRTTSDLVKNDEKDTTESPAPIVTPVPTPVPEEPKTKIPCTQTLKMTNDWTIMGDFDKALTQNNKKDRIVLATSAKTKNGEMLWDDSQSWTLAVISEHGAYNLFSQNMPGYVYMEINECFVRGVSTNVVTAYIFSGTDREIRNYVYNAAEDVFVEEQVFTTAEFSTGGINTLYSNFPEYKAK